MVQSIRDLAEVVRHGGSVHATCRGCGRVAIFAPAELLAFFKRRRWSTAWPRFADRLRCEGCGSRDPQVAWHVAEPPPEDDPPPPRPRFTRQPRPAPVGIDPTEWERARDDRERRQLIRRARG